MERHDHTHGKGCGHVAIKHGDHVDYVHDGHLHHALGSHGDVEDHRIEISAQNPDVCKNLGCNDSTRHADQAEAVPHGDHVDYLVAGRLHHVHGNHCDDHGEISLA